VRVAVAVVLEAGWHVNAHQPLEEFLIPTELSFPGDAPFTVGRVVYPEHKLFTFAFSPDPLAVYEERFALGVELTLADDLPPGSRRVEASLRYQACNDKQCAPPKTIAVPLDFNVVAPDAPVAPQEQALFAGIRWDQSAAPAAAPATAEEPATAAAPAGDWRALAADFEVIGAEAGYLDTAAFLAFLDDAEAGRARAQNFLAGQGLLLMLALVLLGGLALNLTPCVLPLIPINIAIIGAGARAGSRARGFLLGGTYGLGIALVYGALGLVVVLGVSNAFGNLNALWWFNAAMAALFVVLALAMFDIIQIDFSRWQASLGIRKNENGSFLIAFVMGAISALLAGACVAPVVIAVILQTQTLYTEGNPLALALPFLLGLGMALPWPFAGAGLSFLPKPGVWMTRVKYAFGVFILTLAAYYGYEGYGQFRQERLAGTFETDAGAHDGWLSSLENGLVQAQAEGKPVVVDFWATWCKNCIVMDNTTFKDPAVVQRLEDFIKVKYQAEDPSASPAREVLEHYNVLGLPTYIVLKPKG
jgi:thiol:disulfide interchange protein